MTPTSLIIVTDRGSLKAYKVTETPNRGPHLQLVQAFDTTDAHGRYQDKLTDQAGSFPSGAAPGQMNSIAERTGIDTENAVHDQLFDLDDGGLSALGVEGMGAKLTAGVSDG